MQLYDAHRSPNCRKVRVIARELGIDLRIVPFDFEQTKSPDYLAQNPTGKVPTLVDDDGTVVWESGAILIYLAEKDPAHRFLPTTPAARAAVFRWMFFAATHLQPWVSVLGQERLIKARTGGVPDPSLVALAERDLARFLPVLDAHLASREYLVERFTIADVALGCGFEGAEERGVALSSYQHAHAWRERLRGRAAWRD